MDYLKLEKALEAVDAFKSAAIRFRAKIPIMELWEAEETLERSLQDLTRALAELRKG